MRHARAERPLREAGAFDERRGREGHDERAGAFEEIAAGDHHALSAA